jgi:hypothetical protein
MAKAGGELPGHKCHLGQFHLLDESPCNFRTGL